MGGPGRVEIKLSIGAADVAPARELLDWTDDTAGTGDIWFCDVVSGQAEDGTAELELFDHHLIVRLRHWFHAKGESDSTVKYRVGKLSQVPADWRDPDDHSDYKIEGDWTGESRKVSASLKATVPGHDITSAVAHGKPLADALFSADQRAFADAVGGVDWARLQPLGPIHALRWEEEMRKDLGIELGGERWIAGDLEFLELSIRVKSDDAEEWQERFTRWADEKELGVSAVATTKTEAVLHHFAAHLQP